MTSRDVGVMTRSSACHCGKDVSVDAVGSVGGLDAAGAEGDDASRASDGVEPLIS